MDHLSGKAEKDVGGINTPEDRTVIPPVKKSGLLPLLLAFPMLQL